MENTVSEQALIKRINRKLAHEDERLRKNRGARWWSDLGDFYTTDMRTNFLTGAHLDLEQYGRGVGALAEWEEVKP